MGIPDEDDIIRLKQEKEEKLKQTGFNIENFEQKYDRELKKRADKKKKLEEDKVDREKEQYTFYPDLTRQRTKSPINVINRGSLESQQNTKRNNGNFGIDFGTPDTLSINNNEMQQDQIVNLKYPNH